MAISNSLKGWKKVLAQRELNTKDLKGVFLSPGNIFWKQKSGSLVLISSKADFLNRELIEKLARAESTLLIDHAVDMQLQNTVMALFKAHEEEILIKAKKEWREQLIILFGQSLSKESLTQFEVNQMAWAVFSLIDQDEAKKYFDLDIDLFTRSLNVASSYVFCAFLLGYYSDSFLKQLFTLTFKSLMQVEYVEGLLPLKEKLENCRRMNSLTESERQFLSHVYQDQKILLNERYDGSGVLKINKNEMIDLELVLVALCAHFSFAEKKDERTIFFEIKSLTFQCEERILHLLRRTLSMNDVITKVHLSA
ncbi:MAG: hypothetical protein KBD76_09710 [Bacteriovorax sp.]|nr:hypothetical protein [Bacteriovorax sp.]